MRGVPLREAAGSLEAAAEEVKTEGPQQASGPSVYALIQNPAGKCLVLRRAAASGWSPGKWDLPGGKADAGEQVEEALLREIREEAGLKTTVGGLLGTSRFEVRGRQIDCFIFHARSETSDVCLSEEHDRFAWVKPEELAGLDLCPQFGCIRSLATSAGGLL